MYQQQQQQQNNTIIKQQQQNESSNKWRIILSIGLLLPTLAAIVGIVAWAISIEVASDTTQQASSNTMFRKPVSKQRSSSIPSSLPLIATQSNHNNHHQRILSNVDRSNNRISSNTKKNNQYSDDGSGNVQALTSTVNLNIRSSHLMPDEQKEPEARIGEASTNSRDELKKNNGNKINLSREQDNGPEPRNRVDDDSLANRKQHKERDKDYSNDEQRDSSKNASGDNGATIGNNDDNNNNSKHNHQTGHKSDILPKNKGVLAQSVYIVSPSGQQQDNKNLMIDSRNDHLQTGEASFDRSSNHNNQSSLANNVDINDFEAIANAIATTITATATESDLPTETNSDPTTTNDSLAVDGDENVDFAQSEDNIDHHHQQQRKSAGEHVAEVIDHIVEQRRQQIKSKDSSANGGDGGKMPQIVVVAPVGGGQHLMKAHSLVKAQDSTKEIVKKPTTQILVAKSKVDTEMASNKKDKQQKQLGTHSTNPIYSNVRSKTGARPLAARLLGPQTTTLSPFELDSLSGGGTVKQAIRYSEPVEVITDDDTDDRMLRSESQSSPVMMLASASNDNTFISSNQAKQQQQYNNNNYPVVANIAEPSDDQHHRSLLVSSSDDMTSDYHLSHLPAMRSRLPRHEASNFGLVKETRQSSTSHHPSSEMKYNRVVKSYQSPDSSTANLTTAVVGTAEQLIKDHITRSSQRSPSRSQTMNQQHQQQYSNNRFHQNDGTNMRPRYAHSEPTDPSVQAINERHESRFIPQELSSSTTSTSTTEQSVSSSSALPDVVNSNNRFTNRASTYQHESPLSDGMRSPSMIESQQQQQYLPSQNEYAPAQSLEQAVQSQQVVTIEYPSPKAAPATEQQQQQQQLSSSSQSSLPQFADQVYNVPAHLAETVINDLQKSASAPEIYQGPPMQQQQQQQSSNSNSNQQQQQQASNALTDEQQIELIGRIFRMQESDIRSRMAQGRANNGELSALELRKRAFASYLDDLTRQKTHRSSNIGPFAQQSSGQQQSQLIPTLMAKGPLALSHVGSHVVDNVVSSRQPRIADRMQVMHQQPTLINPALALQRVLSAASPNNQLKATSRQGNNLPASYEHQQQQQQQQQIHETAAASDTVATVQDQEAQDSYGQMPAYHMPQGGGYGGGGNHHGGNDYEQQHDKKSKGITFHFGGGPIGGGSQLITSPMGIFKHMLLPLLPNPNVHMTGKVVFGVVLEKSTGFGAQKKKSYKFWGR